MSVSVYITVELRLHLYTS